MYIAMIHTLRGIFPEPKQTPKKNFIRENVRHIKRMQGILKNSTDAAPAKIKSDKYRNIPASAATTNPRPKVHTSKSSTTPSAKKDAPKVKSRKTREHQIQTAARGWKSLNCSSFDDFDVTEEKVTHRSVQTESTTDLQKLYQSGVIKYASKYKKQTHASPDHGSGDHVDACRRSPTIEDGLCSELGSTRISDKQNFVKQNALAVKQRTVKARDVRDPTMAPPEYKKGVLPKYMQELKGEGDDADVPLVCPQGHIMLPDEERKETLRVLRETYAQRVQELNSMPVKTDTLRQRKRKMEIEDELKKIDEGIKVFQRPRVFVKINT